MIIEKTAIRKDKNLLTKAQAVFGAELVIDAFVCTWDIEGDTKPEDVVARLSTEMHGFPELNRGGLSYDSQTIRLVFCNGRAVEFSNSEWAEISVPSGESYEA